MSCDANRAPYPMTGYPRGMTCQISCRREQQRYGFLHSALTYFICRHTRARRSRLVRLSSPPRERHLVRPFLFLPSPAIVSILFFPVFALSPILTTIKTAQLLRGTGVVPTNRPNILN